MIILFDFIGTFKAKICQTINQAMFGALSTCMSDFDISVTEYFPFLN